MTLADRIAELLADGPARTVPELGRALRARDIIVRDALRSDARFGRSPAAPGRSPQARAWVLTGELVPTRPDSSPASQSLERGTEPGEVSPPAESFWRFALSDAAPHSVGEAVAAVERERAA